MTIEYSKRGMNAGSDEFGEIYWNNILPVLKYGDKKLEYTPGQRESQNIEDKRNKPYSPTISEMFKSLFMDDNHDKLSNSKKDSFSPLKYLFDLGQAATRQTGVGVAKSAYEPIKNLMEHGYTPGAQDVTGVENAAKVLPNLFGGGALRNLFRAPTTTEGLGSFLGKTGSRKSSWTPEMQNFLRGLEEKHVNTYSKNKAITKDFRERYPDYSGSDETIQRMSSRLKVWGGVNTEGGAKTTLPDRDIELGSFGGRGRFTSPEMSDAHKMDWLQSQRPVDEAWVREWAKNADVPIKDVRGEGTTKYMRLESSNPPRPGEKYPTVRIPTEEGKHIGTYLKPSEIGNLFDVGLGTTKPGGQSISPSRINAKIPSLINQAGMPYANREALDAALKWRFSKAPPSNPLEPPGTGNWLISEEMAPRLPIKKIPEPPKISPDPNQLKLLSQGYTPADILKILQQNKFDPNAT